jgi:tetratricopeptide (TPR) repeat protein
MLRAIKKLRQRGEYSQALDSCSMLIQNENTRGAGLRARASVYADIGSLDLEVADRETLAEISPHEPADYFDLGVALWKRDRLNCAADAFIFGLALGDRENFHYYTNATRMHLVSLLIALGRRDEARRECALLPDGYESYLPFAGVVSKEQLARKLSSSPPTG